jgi:putative transcriptional regulator
MTEKVALKKLGLKIKQLRTEKGLSQLALGIEIDVEKSNISRMESGRVNVRFYTLFKVAKALNIDLSELVDLK